jgi:hypothetical protein
MLDQAHQQNQRLLEAPRPAFITAPAARAPSALAAPCGEMRRLVMGPAGGNVRSAAISSHPFFANRLEVPCLVDDHSTALSKNPSTGHFLPDLPSQSASSGSLGRQSARAAMYNGTHCLAMASSRTFPPAGPTRTRSRTMLYRPRKTYRRGRRKTPPSAASHWSRNPTTSNKKPYTVNGNVR